MNEKSKPDFELEDNLLVQNLAKIPVDNLELHQALADKDALVDSIDEFVVGELAQSSGYSLEQIEHIEKLLSLKRKRDKDSELNTLFHTRLKYSGFILLLCILWMFFIGCFVTMCGLQKLKVSDAVQIALITTTTINVLGIYYIVANWLFPKKHISESKKLKE